MTRSRSMLGAASGGIFAVVLVVAAGDGSEHFSPIRAIASVAALTLAIPFVVYVGSLLRAADRGDGWLAGTATAAGVTGIALKLSSAGPELAVQRAHLADGTAVHQAMTETGAALTVLCLYPLALFCVATAVIALQTRVLPVWLGAGAALTGAALAVNGAFLKTSSLPALLLFLAWSLATSVQQLLSARRQPRRLADPTPAQA